MPESKELRDAREQNAELRDHIEQVERQHYELVALAEGFKAQRDRMRRLIDYALNDSYGLLDHELRESSKLIRKIGGWPKHARIVGLNLSEGNGTRQPEQNGETE